MPPVRVPPVQAPRVPAPQNNPIEADDGPELGMPTQPTPFAGREYGDPLPQFNGNPYAPTFAGAQAFLAYPYNYLGSNMWYGPNRMIQGFGYFPTRNFNYPFGPPLGPGLLQCSRSAPQYYSFDVRNYGPAYPSPGGINGGRGYYQGW